MSNYTKGLYNDYIKVEEKNRLLKYENKLLKLRLDIAESEQQRLQKLCDKQLKIIDEKNKEMEELENKIARLNKKLEMVEYEKNKYLSKLNTDGTNAGIPTSQTPIHKKKPIPNSRPKSDKHIGGQENHKKNKMAKFNDDQINEEEMVTLDKCPYCNSGDLEKLEHNEITKDETDYKIKNIKKRYSFIQYKCKNCGRIVKANIPVNLKEDNQYGSNVQATALTLANIGNVPINKIRRIISGLTMDEINLSEGFIAKLQKRAALKLEEFISDLKFYITHLNLLYWDDTVISINTKRACMRFYGNEDVALYCAHEQKNKTGLDKDNVLNLLSSNSVVEHDHNIINYNDEYSFINAECCQHLLRDLEKVKTNIPNRTWSTNIKELFKEYDHKRKVLIEKKIDQFSDDEFNNFLSQINTNLLLGVEEHIADDKVYYADKEEALLIRLMEYRDNYIYWTLDFKLPFTNNLSERALRGIKSKMKIAGQFQNITTAEYYAYIRSYIETCYRNEINGHEALIRLINDNPYTLDEILEKGKINLKKGI